MTSFRVLTWCCVIFLAVLSLLPGKWLAALSLLPAMKMVRTVLPDPLEHFVAYAGVAAIAMAGYGPSLGGVRIVGGLCMYAGSLEYVRHFSPGRHPSIWKFTGSALGALCGGLAVVFLWRLTSVHSRSGVVSPVRSGSDLPDGDHGAVLLTVRSRERSFLSAPDPAAAAAPAMAAPRDGRAQRGPEEFGGA
jgi:VanZ family protein